MVEPVTSWKIPDLEGVDDLSAQVLRAFLRAARLHAKLMFISMKGSGVHHGQAMCLRLLSVNDGVAQRDVATMMHVAPPTMSRMLQAMERAGLVERRPDEVDQRLTRVFLTDVGRDRERAMAVAAAEYINATIATMPEGDRRELVRLLDELSDTIARAVGHLRGTER